MLVLKTKGSAPDGPDRSSGFTLIEVVAAMAIMAIVLLAVYRLHAQTISMNGTVRFYTTAPLLAQMRLAAISTEPEGQTAGSGDFGENYPGYAWQVTMEDTTSEYLGEDAEHLKKIEIIITLNENERTYRLRTYQFVPEKG